MQIDLQGFIFHTGQVEFTKFFWGKTHYQQNLLHFRLNAAVYHLQAYPVAALQ